VASTIKIKRSSVAGKIPTTSDITTGELAINTKDQKLYSSNGTAVFAVGSKLTNLVVSGNTTITKLIANGSLGTSGYVLKTNGSTVYWDAASSGSSGSGPGLVSITKKSLDSLTGSEQIVTNVGVIAANAYLQVANAVSTYATKNNPTFTGTVDTASAHIKNQTLTDGATINWNTASGQVATVTLGGNRTMAAPTNLKVGTYILHVYQDATGSRNITWNSVFKWAAGAIPSLTATANAHDVISFVSDGTYLYGSFLPDVK
jgi:hypothetical protein